MGNTRGLTDKPVSREDIYEDGKLVAHHGSDVVLDPESADAVQVADPDVYPSANATTQDPLAVDAAISPAYGLDPDHTSTNEIQIVTLAIATGGTFTLSFEGEETSDLAYNVASADLKTALIALSSIGQDGESHDNVTVTGNAGGPFTVTFVNDLGGQDVDLLTADSTGLTTPAPTATPATSVQGAP